MMVLFAMIVDSQDFDPRYMDEEAIAEAELSPIVAKQSSAMRLRLDPAQHTRRATSVPDSQLSLCPSLVLVKRLKCPFQAAFCCGFTDFGGGAMI